MKRLSLPQRHVVALCVTGVYAYLGYIEMITDVFGMILYVTFCNILIFSNVQVTRRIGLVGRIHKKSTSFKSACTMIESIGWMFLLGPGVWYVLKITHFL